MTGTALISMLVQPPTLTSVKLSDHFERHVIMKKERVILFLLLAHYYVKVKDCIRKHHLVPLVNKKVKSPNRERCQMGNHKNNRMANKGGSSIFRICKLTF